MSYNYLPLDHTPTSFQQIKNLLAYRQLISITFAGYEAIEKNGKLNKQIQPEGQINAADILLLHSSGVGRKIPEVVVKLMMALKVKSLSLGKSGITNETVQRLMDMHNNDVLPVVYEHGLALAQMSLPLIGKGQFSYQGQQYEGDMLENLMGWKPLSLKNTEISALLTGTQFAAAYGLCCLIKTEELLQKAVTITGSPVNYFQSVKDAFDYVLAIFSKQINIDSEKTELALEHLDFSGYELALPLDFLAIAVAGLANIYSKNAQVNLSRKYVIESLLNEINILCTPVSAHLLSAENAGIKCMAIIENADKILMDL